jgi:cysteine desulfurase
LSLIYLDYNRTTPIAPAVAEAMKPFWMSHFMLPSQDHAHGQAVSEALENAREGLGQLVGCEPFELVFTSGGTEANNLAIRGMAGQLSPGHLLVGALESDAVLAAASSLQAVGWELEIVPANGDGEIAVGEFDARLRANTRLACVQLASPVTGTIQPIRQLADLCRDHRVLLHCDATAAFGKIPVSAQELGCDTISVSGHKFFGPKGTGAIYVRRGLELSPIMFGEPREMGLRPGAENVPGYVGLGAAAALAANYAIDAPVGLAELSERFLNAILNAIVPTPILLAATAPRLPNTVALELPGNARRLLKSARHVAAATSLSESPPDEIARSLRAIGRTDAQVARTLVVSLGWTTTRDQIDRAVGLLAEAWDTLSAH